MLSERIDCLLEIIKKTNQPFMPNLKELKDSRIIYLFTFIMIDYLLTYIGIHTFEFIQEGNPVLIWLFELPIIIGFPIRVVMASLVSLTYLIIYRAQHFLYNKIIFFALLINGIILGMHLSWIVQLIHIT